MSRAALFGFVLVAAVAFAASVQAQGLDELAQNLCGQYRQDHAIRKTRHRLWHLGNGGVITAAHVMGRWGFLKSPRVQIAGLDLPAKVVKEGSADEIDLTLLAVDEASLPVSLRLRRNPLCRQPPRPGESVVAVVPNEAMRSHILSPLQISPNLRTKFNTLTSEVAEPSGSGVFDSSKRCLHGIMSKRVQKFTYRKNGGKFIAEPAGFAGYFVPASQISKFVPAEFRF